MQREPQRPEPELPAWMDKIPQADPVVLLGIAPTVLYILVDRLIDTRPAIAVCVISAIAVFLYQRRKLPRTSVVFLLGVLGAILMIITGVLGLINDSDKTFWTFDPIEDFIVGGIFLVSVLVGRPIVSSVVRELFPSLRERVPARHSVWTLITLVWGVKIVATGFFRLWFLDVLEGGLDVWILGTWDVSDWAWLRTVTGGGVNIVLFLWTIQRLKVAGDRLTLEAARAEHSQLDATDSGDASEVVADSEVTER